MIHGHSAEDSSNHDERMIERKEEMGRFYLQSRRRSEKTQSVGYCPRKSPDESAPPFQTLRPLIIEINITLNRSLPE